MKGDFSRDTFDPAKHFSRVLMQQGRVQLDADWNEQAAITLHYLRNLNVDLVGQHWGPKGHFKVVVANVAANEVFTISPGHYYVNGVLCDNATGPSLAYSKQAGFPFPDSEPTPSGVYLVYLDVWERHITWIDDASIREVALGGPDTATRAQVMWQAKLLKLPPEQDATRRTSALAATLVEKLRSRHNIPTLRARAKRDAAQTDLCAIPPESRYRGAENQLYRVEIHAVVRAADGRVTAATFKWSRDNGSVLFPVITTVKSSTEITVTLAHLGRDDISSLTEGDIVELVDNQSALSAAIEPLCQVKKIDRTELTVTLDCSDTSKISNKRSHVALRRWDHKGDAKVGDGALKVVEVAAPPPNDPWLAIEDGIEIQFGHGGDYSTGDYWLIPARVATGDVEWLVRRDADDNPVRDVNGNVDPLPKESTGVAHYYAPLAFIEVDAAGASNVVDCRFEINTLAVPAQ